jgi:uncharacterized damage-inducible protein DinB
MNYYGPKDLADSFRTVRANTLTIAEEIPEDKYSFRAGPGARSVGELLAHLGLAFNFQYQIHAVERRKTLEGFDFPALMKQMTADEQAPRTKAQTIELLRANGDKWAAWIETQNEDFLAERVQMPKGSPIPSKTRFEMILSVKEHEMHHRGQLMLIERIVGIVPHLTRQSQARIAQAQATAAKS